MRRRNGAHRATTSGKSSRAKQKHTVLCMCFFHRNEWNRLGSMGAWDGYLASVCNALDTCAVCLCAMQRVSVFFFSIFYFCNATVCAYHAIRVLTTWKLIEFIKLVDAKWLNWLFCSQQIDLGRNQHRDAKILRECLWIEQKKKIMKIEESKWRN